MTEFIVQVTHGNQSRPLDLLGYVRPRQLMIELTSRCNLRCAYCPKGDPQYNAIPGRDDDMEPAWQGRALSLCQELAPHIVMLCGTGETTFMNGWMGAVAPYQALPSTRTAMISNFGRVLSETEVDTLARFSALTVSIDTRDEEIMARVRRKVSVARITHNIVLVRAAARKAGIRGPEINVNCTVQSTNADKLKDLAIYCATVGVNTLSLSSLLELDAPNDVVHGIEHFPAERLREIRDHVLETIKVCQQMGLPLQVQPRLATLLDGAREEAITTPNRVTRLCMQPWQQYTIAADGKIYPCCVTTDSVDDLSTPGNPFDAEGIRTFRKRLLDGDMPDMCKHCSNAPLGDNVSLMQMVAQYIIENAPSTDAQALLNAANAHRVAAA